MKLLLPLLACTLSLWAQADLKFLNHGRPVLDAHNCYPYEGRWADRIDRALSAGFPVSIEQDLAWYAEPGGRGRPVIVHDPKSMTGAEPDLRSHFFERVRPLVQGALREGKRGQWPLVILHLDFKMNDAPLLAATWDLLGEYETWITTATKGADASRLAPLDRKPILVLTEDSDAQEAVFFKSVPVGGKLRLFGSAHNSKIPGSSDGERFHLAATLPPENRTSHELPALVEQPLGSRGRGRPGKGRGLDRCRHGPAPGASRARPSPRFLEPLLHA